MTTYELLTQPIPLELFHYTHMEGLRGILSSHLMYATDSLFLNDTTEIANSLPTTRDALSDVTVSNNPKVVDTMRHLLEEEHSTGFLSSSKSQYFILSFSSAGDDLQQWRGYGDDTHGVCIGFDLRKLRPPSWMDTMVTFARCVYVESEKAGLIKNLAYAFSQRDSDLSTTVDSPHAMAMEWAVWQINNPALQRSQFMDDSKRKLKAQIEYSLTSFRVDLVRLSCHFKSPHFASENEWRLVLPHLRTDEFRSTVLKERHGRPYVEFVFQGFDKLPITSIRLGANADEARLRQILSDTGYAASVEKSQIPYRSFRSK